MTSLLGSLTELPTAVIVLLKMTVLLGAGWVLHFGLVRRNPRWRVLVWRGVMAGMILLPVGELLLPKLQIAVAPPPVLEEPVARVVEHEPVTPVQSDAYVAPVAPVPVSNAREPFPILLWAKQHPSFMLLTGWGLISLILAVRVLCVTHRVRRVVTASESAPERIRRLMEKVAEDLRCRTRVDLRVTPGLGSPFLAGVFRPVLVLPERMTDERHAGELPAVFAHELAHLHAHDLIWIAAGKWLAVLWWFHPLVWTARAAYIGACEEVCDAVAADYVGGAPSYSRTLARAALELVVDAPAPGGIPMIRTSDITRRLRNLRRGIKAAALARRRVVAGILLGCATLVVLGCLQWVRAGHRGTAESPSSEKQLKKLIDDFVYDGKINTPIPSTSPVDLDVIVSVLATQENLLRDIDCSFSAVSRSNETGEVRDRYEGSWRYDTRQHYQLLSVSYLSYFDGDERNPDLLQIYAYDGEEMREWSDSNNSGNFSTEPLNSGALSFPFGPYVLSRHPLRQEEPLLTYSEFLSAKEIRGIQEPFQPTIVGWEKLRLAEGKLVETVVIDVAIKGTSFKVKMWLDPRKQFLPRRIVHYTPDDYDSTYHGPIVDIVTDEYKEVGTPDGPVFVPVKGRVAGISIQENKYASTTRLLVERIAINQDMSPDDYRFEWPDGARILNLDNNDWGYMKGGRYFPGRAYEAAEEAKEAAESNDSNQVTASAGEGRPVRFPEDRSLGKLKVRDEGPHVHREEGWEPLCDARGTVRVPAGKQLRLHVGLEAAKDLSPLTELEPEDLHHVVLRGTEVRDDALKHLAHLTGLQGLDLSYTLITDEGLKHLNAMTSLKNLGLDGTQLGDPGLANIKGMTSLESLDLKGTNITDAGMVHLKSLKDFRHLLITGIGDEGVAHLSELPALEFLQIQDARVSEASIPSFKRMKSIKRVLLSGDQIYDDLLAALRAALPDCEIHDPQQGRYPPPAWRKKFNAVYRLEDGEVLRRVAPPFIPQRMDYYRHEHASQAEAIPRGPDYMTFHWDKKLKHWGMGFTNDLSVRAVLHHTLKLESFEYEDPDGILSIQLPGDWIVRKTAPHTERLKALENILKDELGEAIRFEQRTVERDVIVASGKFAHNPLSDVEDQRSIHMFAAKYDSDGHAGHSEATVAELLRHVGDFVSQRVIDETESTGQEEIEIRFHDLKRLRQPATAPAERARLLNLLLENLSKQTSLQFRLERRNVNVWFVTGD